MPPANRRKAGVVRLLGICGLGGGLAFLLIGGLGLVVSSAVFESLPGYPDIEPLSQKSNTYAAQNDGTSVLLASFYDQNRIEVDWDEISPYARDAVIAATPAREIKKMRLAIGAEKKFPQNDILRQYLNITGFGGTVYGNEAAANYYFGTTAAELTLPQAANLVEIVDNPAKFRLDNPGSETNGYAVNKARRDYIPREMVEQVKITAAEFQAAVATPVQPAIQGTFNDSCRGRRTMIFRTETRETTPGRAAETPARSSPPSARSIRVSSGWRRNWTCAASFRRPRLSECIAPTAARSCRPRRP
ncbi:hypothetical protein E3O28_02905 [Cryobacterium sp. TMT2-14]|nr:hypothetical protein E3O28_02905 [Cryobacterium sp. TMT2-14]